MSFEFVVVVLVLAGTVVLFASDRLRLDLVALLGLLALLLTGVLTTSEALAGFADPVVIMIAGLFVVGEGLFRTGVADAMGRWLRRVAGDGPVRLVVSVMVVAAVLSAFLSSTGTVAVMLPVVVGLARAARLPASRLLMPLAFASLLGGMLTLIGTPPNIVVSDQLRSAGLEPFGFFAFTPVGLVMLVIGIVYMVTLGSRLLPTSGEGSGAEGGIPTLADLAADYQLPAQLQRLHVPSSSPLAGRTLAEAGLRMHFGVTVLAVGTRGQSGWRARRAEPETVVHGHDRLFVLGDGDSIQALVDSLELLTMTTPERLPGPLMLVEVIIPPRSPLAGRTVKTARWHDSLGVTVLGLKRAGESVTNNLTDTKLRAGDALLVSGGRRAIRELRRRLREVIVVTEPEEVRALEHDTRRAPLALAILLVMLALMTLGLTANVTAVLLAAVAMVLGGCLKMTDAYRSINWEGVVLIAAVLPMATALDTSGGTSLIVQGLVDLLTGANPLLLLAGLFVLTSALSQVISNTATTVLIAPIAIQLGLDLGVTPAPLLMTVAVAASTAFATPIASPVNTLVLNPGGYRFRDFLRLGIPLQLLILGATLLLVPLLFPL